MTSEKDIRESIGHDFSDAEINAFFDHPIWREIETMLMIRREFILSALLDTKTSREEDLVNKGEGSLIAFMLNLKHILKEKEGGKDE